MPPDLLLYVEDEDASWHAAEQRLRRSYNLLRAANDREACAALVEHKEKIVAILMDIELRGSALEEHLEVVARIDAEHEKRLVPVFRI